MLRWIEIGHSACVSEGMDKQETRVGSPWPWHLQFFVAETIDTVEARKHEWVVSLFSMCLNKRRSTEYQSFVPDGATTPMTMMMMIIIVFHWSVCHSVSYRNWTRSACNYSVSVRCFSLLFSFSFSVVVALVFCSTLRLCQRIACNYQQCLVDICLSSSF